jgi:glutathione S-transferase
VPALVADEGETLFDSAVIVDYLDALAGGGRIIPATGPARWRVKCVEALADGMVDAVVLMRHERTARPADKQWPPSFESQKLKVDRALDSLEGQAWLFDDRLDAGRIAIGCGLGYLDLRFPDHGWRQRCEILARWYDHFLLNPAAAATWPVVPPEQG